MAQMYSPEIARLKSRLGDQALSDHVIRMFLIQNNGNEERTFQVLSNQGWNEPRLPDTMESAGLLSNQPPPIHHPSTASRANRSSWQYEETLRAEPSRHHPVAAMGPPSGYPVATPRRTKSTSPFHSPSDTTLTNRAEVISAQRSQLESMRSEHKKVLQQLTAINTNRKDKQRTLDSLRSNAVQSSTAENIEFQKILLQTLQEDVKEETRKVEELQRSAGVRRSASWECYNCLFLNHPALHRCESCSQQRNDIPPSPLGHLLSSPWDNK